MADISLKWNHRAFTGITRNAIIGLNQAAEYVRATTVPLTPLDEGPLRNTLLVTPANPASPVATVSSDLPYAVEQHENLDYHHRHGQAKYLETGVNQSTRIVSQIIANAIR